MIREGKFGVQEAVSIATVTISTKLFFTSPGFLMRFVGTAGWMMTLVSCTVSIIAFTFIYSLLKRFPGKGITEAFDRSLGPVAGFIFSLLFAVGFLESAGILIREFSDVSITFAFPLAPVSVLSGMLVVAAMIAAFFGLEGIVRYAKLTVYIALFAYVFLLIISFKRVNIYNLFPFWGYGAGQILLHGVRRSSAYTEILVLAVIAGSLQGTKYLKKAGYLSLIFSGLIISSGLLFFVLEFPYNAAQEMTTPIYTLSRGIKYGPFFQRLDPIFLFLWANCTFITVTMLFYCLVSIYCKMFRIQDSKPIILPMGTLMFTMALIPRDFSSVVYGSVQTIREYGWAVFYVLPFIAWLVALLRKKKEVTSNA